MRFGILLALGLLIAAPSPAQTEADRAAAQVVISQLIVDTEAVDIEGITSITPPVLLATLGAMSGQSAAEMEAQLLAQMRDMMEQVIIEDYAMDLDAAPGGVTSAGRPYFVVPSRMTMEVIGAGRVLSVSETLAFEDNGQWWLVRVDNPVMDMILDRAFPDLAGIEFAPATVEELQ